MQNIYYWKNDAGLYISLISLLSLIANFVDTWNLNSYFICSYVWLCPILGHTDIFGLGLRLCSHVKMQVHMEGCKSFLFFFALIWFFLFWHCLLQLQPHQWIDDLDRQRLMHINDLNILFEVFCLPQSSIWICSPVAYYQISSGVRFSWQYV